jgi:mono/diheme cytochrome c family protein
MLLLLLVLLIGIGLSVIGQTSNTDQDTRMPVAKGKKAKSLFKQYCVKCHGADGAGITTFGQIEGAPDFTDSGWQNRVGDQQFVDSITYGRSQMPPFGKKLSKEQITSLLAYVRALKR